MYKSIKMIMDKDHNRKLVIENDDGTISEYYLEPDYSKEEKPND